MIVNLNVDPTIVPMTWKQYCKSYSTHSIAIDGFVIGGPNWQGTNEGGPRANFNHHENVDRLATRATCAQVLMAIRHGLFNQFRDSNGSILINIDSNDCDHDVCTTIALLRHSHMVDNAIAPSVNRLVDMVDKLDTTAGAYPFSPDLPFLEELAWIFEPYSIFRLNGGLDNRNGNEYISIINDVENRILSSIVGKGKVIPLDTRYEVLQSGNGWVSVKEIGGNARTAMFHDGIRAYVAPRERNDGGYTVTLGRMSAYVDFDLDALYYNLNKEEGLLDSNDKWGGSNTVGGSPRVKGTSLSLEIIYKVINDVISNK